MTEIQNYIGGRWLSSSLSETELRNPSTGEMLGHLASGTEAEVADAVSAAKAAFPEWQAMPTPDRIQFLFRFKQLLEEHFDEIARLVTIENGKTLNEAKGELRRGIENVEVACGIPILMQGYNLDDIAHGIDETMTREPLGVVGIITPFNFPVMIPLWFLPYAIACGNTVVIKPSERVPFGMLRVIELLEKTGLPKGVVNLVNGGKTTVDAMLDHPDIRAISFVGSTPVAKYIYGRGSTNGKRVQCQGGAKNHVVVLPDADPETTSRIIADSAFGCAGQRCLAVSVTLTVGDAKNWFTESISDRAASLKVGDGLEPETKMGPVITSASRDRVRSLIEKGVKDGAKPVVDGRQAKISGQERGNFLAPTILDGVPATSELTETEIFGPVLSLVHLNTVEEAIEWIGRSAFGNAASIFTTSGASARQFRKSVSTGNVGINIGVAAPMAYFPFSGWKGSFFGVMHAQGRDAIEFYTDKKVTIERWPKHWSRQF